MPNQIVTKALDQVASGESLETAQATAVLVEIMEGRVSDIQIAGFLCALRAKEESVSEIVGLAKAMRSLAKQVRPQSAQLLDTAGTGGGVRTFNVSTIAAIIAAGAGCKVAKHGNRSATGLSGSADLLEALDVQIEIPSEAIAEAIDTIGFGFMFAPAHHPSTRQVVPVRQELAVRTVFNLLGPLTNPAAANCQIMGVSDPKFLEKVAHAFLELDVNHALIIRSEDGLDELSLAAPTKVYEVQGRQINSYLVDPQDLGLAFAPLTDLAGGTPAKNASIAKSIFSGEESPCKDFAILNAAAAIYAGGRAGSFSEGVKMARNCIDSGEAQQVLNRYREWTRKFEKR